MKLFLAPATVRLRVLAPNRAPNTLSGCESDAAAACRYIAKNMHWMPLATGRPGRRGPPATYLPRGPS